MVDLGFSETFSNIDDVFGCIYGQVNYISDNMVGEITFDDPDIIYFRSLLQFINNHDLQNKTRDFFERLPGVVDDMVRDVCEQHGLEIGLIDEKYIISVTSRYTGDHATKRLIGKATITRNFIMENENFSLDLWGQVNTSGLYDRSMFVRIPRRKLYGLNTDNFFEREFDPGEIDRDALMDRILEINAMGSEAGEKVYAKP